jgi:cytochrome bd-type quinol oxidase subunit 2
MADQTDRRQDLLLRINARRAGVEAYLRQRRPRVRRWATVTLVLTSLSAVFTAGPALGGVPFAEAVQNALGLEESSAVWRTLCFLALLVSVGATVLTNISRSHDAVAELSTVEAADAELEGLATLLEFGTLSIDDGVKLYQQYVTKIPFVDDAPAVAGRGGR